MTSIDIDDIAGPSGDSFKFTTIGDTIKGIIEHVDKNQRTSQFNGNLEEVLRITIETNDGGNAIIWPVINTNVEGDGYPTRMARAIATAVRNAGATTLEKGGTLAVKYTEDIPTDKGNPAKGYAAKYEPPKAGAVTAADIDGQEGAAAPDEDLF